MVLNRVHPEKAIKNSENYVWFALESFFTKKCSSPGKPWQFEDPQAEDWQDDGHPQDDFDEDGASRRAARIEGFICRSQRALGVVPLTRKVLNNLRHSDLACIS